MKNLPSSIQALLFDHDGVIVNSEPLHRHAWMQLCASIGLEATEADIAQHIGKISPKILQALLYQFDPTGGRFPGLDLEELARKKAAYYREALKQGVPLIAGVRECLKWAAENKIPCAVVSNAKRQELIAGLDQAGITSAFRAIFSRDDLPHPKPHPSAYQTAALFLGVPFENCLAIDDSPAGLESALLGGIPAVGVLTNFSLEVISHPVPGRPDLEPKLVVRDLNELYTAFIAEKAQIPSLKDPLT